MSCAAASEHEAIFTMSADLICAGAFSVGATKGQQVWKKEQGEVQSSFSFFSVAMMTTLEHFGRQNLGAGLQATSILAQLQSWSSEQYEFRAVQSGEIL